MLWLLIDMCCAQTGVSLPQSVRQWLGQLQASSNEGLPAILRRNGQVGGLQKGVPNNAISAPELADFFGSFI